MRHFYSTLIAFAVAVSSFRESELLALLVDGYLTLN